MRGSYDVDTIYYNLTLVMVDVFGPKIGGGYSTTLSEEGTTAVLTV